MRTQAKELKLIFEFDGNSQYRQGLESQYNKSQYSTCFSLPCGHSSHVYQALWTLESVDFRLESTDLKMSNEFKKRDPLRYMYFLPESLCVWVYLLAFFVVSISTLRERLRGAIWKPAFRLEQAAG